MVRLFKPDGFEADGPYYLQLAMETAELGGHTEALNSFDKAYAAAWDDAERAAVLASRGQFLLEEMARDSEALSAAGAALALVENALPSPMVSMIRGVCRWVAAVAAVEAEEEAIANARKAFKDFEIVMAADPADHTARAFAAEVSLLSGEFDKAITLLTDLLNGELPAKQRPVVISRIAAVHRSAGRLEEAERVALRGIAETTESRLPHLYVELGYAQLSLGNYWQAAESLSSALSRVRELAREREMGPRGRVISIETLLPLIEILYADGQIEPARQRLAEIAPLLKQIDARCGSDLVWRLCETLIDAKELAQLESLCSEFLEAPDIPAASEVRIRTYLQYVQAGRAYDRGEYAESVRKLEPLLTQTLDPAWLEEWVLTLLGPSYLGVDNYAAARDVYARLAGWNDAETPILQDARHKVRFIDARFAYDAKRYREAAQVLEELLRISTIRGGFLAELHYSLGLCHENLGELDAARGHYRAVRSVEHAGDAWREWAAARDRALAEVRRHPLV